MSDVSIGIGIRDNASGVLPGISRAIEELAQSSEKLQKATDWGAIGNQVSTLTKYREELEKINRVNKDMSRQGGAGGAGGGGGSAMSQGFFNTPGNFVNSIGMMGHDAGGGVAGIVGTAGNALKGLEGLGSLIPVIGMVAVGLALFLKAANAVAKQYEEMVPNLMEYNALIGKAGGGDKGSKALRDSMNNVATLAAGYGYDLATGLSIGGGLAQGGGSQSSMGTVMSFMRGTGIDQGLGIRAESLRSRFGVAGLEGMWGGFGQTGMTAGRFGGYATQAADTMESALSRGVVKGMHEILSTQNWMASGGELFRGTQGARLYQQLEGGIVGATALSSQKDAIMYRAAREVGGGGFLETQKQLEKGLSPEMFSAIRKQVMAYAGSSITDQVMLMRNTFGVSYTMAEKLLSLPSSQAYSVYQSGAPSYSGTPEMEGLRLQQLISNNVRNIGAMLYDIRLGLLRVGEGATGAGGSVLKWLRDDYNRGLPQNYPAGDPTNAQITGNYGGVGGLVSQLNEQAGVLFNGMGTYDQDLANLTGSWNSLGHRMTPDILSKIPKNVMNDVLTTARAAQSSDDPAWLNFAKAIDLLTDEMVKLNLGMDVEIINEPNRAANALLSVGGKQ